MSVENHIQSLQEIYNKVQALRQIPQTLLKPGSSSALSLSKSATLSHQSQQIKDLTKTLKSDTVQDALRTAKASERENGLKDVVNLRRESRKRRRAPSPESPAPYVAPERQGASLFPPPKADEGPLKSGELFDYIRRFNREHMCKIHIWKPTRTWSPSDTVDRPAVIRFCIKDILVAYLTVDQSGDSTLVTESVAIFGPREKKSPHSQSDFLVYQSISQQVTKMIHSHPQVSVQSLLDLLQAYQDIYIDRCTVCERVLSPEGYIPPVVRLWTDGKDGERGKWEPKHVHCRAGLW